MRNGHGGRIARCAGSHAATTIPAATAPAAAIAGERHARWSTVVANLVANLVDRATGPDRSLAAVLQAQALSVEVGGRLVVESATFTVMPRDKVGLVGRNGAGKTSLFRVLGGEAEPKAGRVVRTGGFGYLPQDPRIAGRFDGRTAVTHVLSGRGIDEQVERIE